MYRLSIDSYKRILSIKSTLNSSIIGEALLGLGKTYEAQLMEDTYQDRLVDFYPENIFLIIKQKDFKRIH